MWFTREAIGSSVPKPRFHVDTARSSYVVNDGDFVCWSLLGLPANLIEALIYHNKQFHGTRCRILIKILHVGLCLDYQQIQLKSLYITTKSSTGLDGEF